MPARCGDPTGCTTGTPAVLGPGTLLARLTDVDLANAAFGYMHVRTGTVAGVADCVLWRIAFTGELSYELHVPAHYGLHVWEELLRVGRDLGVAPFGVEAQRILRLEKGHFIVGQDTDGLTQAHTAGLGGWSSSTSRTSWASRNSDGSPNGRGTRGSWGSARSIPR